MRPGITDEMVERAAVIVGDACGGSGIQSYNHTEFIQEDDMLVLFDFGCTASDIYLLAEFALETLRSKK